MKALAGLSDEALLPLALATNVSGPPARMAPRFWSWFGDVVAFEVARRPALRQRLNLKVASDLEPGYPLDLPTEELEAGGLVLLAIGGARGETADAEGKTVEAAMHEVVEGLLLILRDRLAGPAVQH